MTVEEKAASIISKVGLWWPLAEEDQLRQAAGAYDRVARTVLAAARTGSSGADLVTGRGQSGKAVAAFEAHWATYDGAGNAGLPATAQAAVNVADALRQFADAVDDAKTKIINLAIEIGAVLAVGIGLAIFTFGTSAGAAAAQTALLVARGLAVGVGLSGIAASLASGLMVVVAAGALEGFISSIVAQVGKTILSDGDGVSLSEAMNWTAWGAATAPIGLGVGLAARSAFRALRGGDNMISNRLAPGNRMAGDDALPAPSAGGLPEELKKVNPSGSKTNCVNCVTATDDILAGNPLVPAQASSPRTALDLERRYGGKFQDVDGYDQIKSLLLAAGPGARLIVSRVSNGRSAGRGHVFNAYVDSSGHVRFVDGQTGRAVRVWPVQASYKILWTNKP